MCFVNTIGAAEKSQDFIECVFWIPKMQILNPSHTILNQSGTDSIGPGAHSKNSVLETKNESCDDLVLSCDGGQASTYFAPSLIF